MLLVTNLRQTYCQSRLLGRLSHHTFGIWWISWIGLFRARLKMINVLGYQVAIDRLADEDGGGYLATVPELPGCKSDGETRQEAKNNVEDAIRAWIWCAERMGRQVPAPAAALTH